MRCLQCLCAYAQHPAPDDLDVFRQTMLARKFSRSTIKSYMRVAENFCTHTAKPLGDFAADDVRAWLADCAGHNASASGMNVAISALKLFLPRLDVDAVVRPRKDRTLPVVLSREEVRAVIDATANLKHRAMLMLIYSSGLRVSEAATLKLRDVDRQRGLIVLRSAKGRKDRVTLLSQVFVAVLDEYLRQYAPSDWLFAGGGGRGISVRAPFRPYLPNRAARQALSKKQEFTVCVILLPLICWNREPTYGIFSRCWGIKAPKPR
jgi:site-specific recombinase XerD